MNKTKLFVYGGLLLAYLRTAHAMVPYSPSAFLFWNDEGLRLLWAYAAAGLVEGVFLDAYHRLTTHGKDGQTRQMAWGIAGVALLFSGVMNVIEVRVAQGELVLASTDVLVQALRVAIVLIPIIVPALYMAMEIVDNRFPDFRPSKRPPTPFQEQAKKSAPPNFDPMLEPPKGRHSNGHSNDEFRLGPPGKATGEGPLSSSRR